MTDPLRPQLGGSVHEGKQRESPTQVTAHSLVPMVTLADLQAFSFAEWLTASGG